MVTWKIVGVSKVSVLYVYIDYFIPTAITTINQDLNSFKCMINQPHIAGILLESHQLIEAVQLGLQTVRLAFTAGILLESHQLIETVLLGCKPSEISDLASLSSNLHYLVYNYFTFYFISTTITTTNQGLNSFKCMINQPLSLTFCWNPISPLMLHSWATNHTKISDFACISLSLHY